MAHSFTETEAKTKQCPFVRYCSNQLAVIQDKDAPLYEQSNCIASACMAWKFNQREFCRETELWSRSKNQKVNSAWGDDSWWRPVGEDADKEPPDAMGYCTAMGRSHS